MRSLPVALSMFVAACALAGCGPPDAGTKASAEAGSISGDAAATATPANVALSAKGAPQRRDGYWEMQSFDEHGTAMSKQYLCVGAGSENRFSIFDQLADVGSCDKRDFVRTPTGWTFETSCKLMDAVTVQKGAISGDFQTGFRVDQTVTQGEINRKGSVRGKYVGACSAKYKPGDLVGSDGETIGNMLG
jgi:hypothetical protein